MNFPNAVLVHVLAELDAFGEAIRDHKSWASKRAQTDGRTRWPAYQIRNFGIPYRPSEWVDYPLSNAKHQGFSRAVKRLEADGMMATVRGQEGRLTHLQLTPTGLALALESAPSSADVDAIGRALEVTVWSTSEHMAVIEAAVSRKNPNDD